jgi:GTP-binding protein Era
MIEEMPVFTGAEKKKAAFVAVVGRPSVGKSTLVNRICGAKVAIVSSVPQTTRNAIRGIANREQGQLVFVDTPGRHASEKKFNRKLMDVSGRAVNDSDLALYVLDASRAPGPEEEEVAALLAASACKTVAAVNKMDIPGADFPRCREFLSSALPALGAERIFQISAKENSGIDALLDAIFAIAPCGEPFYGAEYYTDQEVDFRIAEIIREQAIGRLREELPHSLYVEVADTELKDGGSAEQPDNESGRPQLWVRAFIVVERESQKGMVVGKGGEMIKAIRLAALKSLRRIFDWKIELDLRVKTGKDWRHNDAALRRIIDR